MYLCVLSLTVPNRAQDFNMKTSAKNGQFTVKAYKGDARTLLAFNLAKSQTKNLAGFTIQCQPKGKKSYFVINTLRFENPSDHAQVASELPNSSVNAPIHRFRWVHVPGSNHQGTKPFFGDYTYTVTPRYFDANHSMQKLDSALSVSVTLPLTPFVKGDVSVGFTRGFTQSQAFVRHFGKKAAIRPKTKELLFDTAQISGKNDEGKSYTFAEEYEWLGFTARQHILDITKEVLKNTKLRLDVFAYDLNEPDVMKAMLTLAHEGRVRVILDDAPLHHDTAKPTPEDQFEIEFGKTATAPAALMRGHFGRFAHDKVLIVTDEKRNALKVLTGSTNLSVTGLYVNSNHVLVIDDKTVAATYEKVFQIAWDGKAGSGFSKADVAKNTASFSSKTLPKMEITFSPHTKVVATSILDGLVARVEKEKLNTKGSVLFAVMAMDETSTGPVFPALRELHKTETIFSYGITDTTKGISLYKPGNRLGVLVTGKPGQTVLPPPFNQVPSVGLGHQVHHKFVVCGFNGKDPVVYCGSSNLALGGEQQNGDNLLAIHDEDIATVFAIEALGLVDHFDFLNKHAEKAKEAGQPVAKSVLASKSKMADEVKWYLSTNDQWALPYFDKNDLRSTDRELFA